jgi:hypothetical protein
MERLFQRYFAWVLFWSLLGMGATPRALAGGQDEDPILILQLFNAVQTPEPVLREAKANVQRIFREAHIQVKWLDGGSVHPSPKPNTLLLTVILAPNAAARNLGRNTERVTGIALGHSGQGNHCAYVFAERTQKLGAQMRDHLPYLANQVAVEGLILGHVIAHEIGHLMLPLGHSAQESTR